MIKIILTALATGILVAGLARFGEAQTLPTPLPMATPVPFPSIAPIPPASPIPMPTATTM